EAPADDEPPDDDHGADEPFSDGLPDLEDLDWDLPSTDPTERASVWPHIERRIAELVAAQTSTLVFANSRRLAERLTSRLNEIWDETSTQRAIADGSPGAVGDTEGEGDATGRRPATVGAPRRPPAQIMAQSGSSSGAAPILARAHH